MICTCATHCKNNCEPSCCPSFEKCYCWCHKPSKEIKVEFVREPHASFTRWTMGERCVVHDPKTNQFLCWYKGNIIHFMNGDELPSALFWMAGNEWSKGTD